MRNVEYTIVVMRRYALAGCYILFMLALLGVILAGYLWLRYGPIESSLDKHQHYYSVGDMTKTDLIVIYPANLVHPTQYTKAATALNHNTGFPVIVLNPPFRIEFFSSNIREIIGVNTVNRNLVLIGHSGGASAACRDIHNQTVSASLLVIGGYCKTAGHKNAVAYIGDDDQFISCKQALHYHQVKCIPGGNHFILTNTEQSSYDQDELLKALAADIRESLAREP